MNLIESLARLFGKRSYMTNNLLYRWEKLPRKKETTNV